MIEKINEKRLFKFKISQQPNFQILKILKAKYKLKVTGSTILNNFKIEF